MVFIPFVIMCVVCWIITVWALVDDGPLSVICIYGFMALFLTIFLICNFSDFLCPDCSTMVVFGSDYCTVCGCELQPHCDACGEICRTAFCKVCGAEQ